MPISNLLVCLGVLLVIILLAIAVFVGGILGVDTSSFNDAFNAIAAQC
ncbi:hypothetical protein [Neobacillus cucumis]|jgi:hypothetical protein|nr:hypothetical protein [Neobacillus cucumis]MBM7652743.1 hypothetical protein [Neobacillus cucumis]MDR4947066.1 hypothetical protein [Neobacillus cucumis]MED4229305.1 hypothetical protein [Neobacillus cucumis]